MYSLPLAETERSPVQGALLGAHENVYVHHISPYVRRWFNRGWRVERLDSGYSTFNCAAMNAEVPLGRIAVQWSDLERQVPFWESGCQTITL